MTTPTRAALEAAAVRYFQRMSREQDKPRNLDEDFMDAEIDYEVENGIDLLDVQLKQNVFGGLVEGSASTLTRDIGVQLAELPEDLRLAALNLAARAIREASRLYIHKLTTPAKALSHSTLSSPRGTTRR